LWSLKRSPYGLLLTGKKKERKKERAFYVYDDDGCSIAAVTYLTNAIREDRFGNFHRELDGFIVVVCM